MLIFPNGDRDERDYLKYIEDEMIEIYGLTFCTIQTQGYILKQCERNDRQEFAHYFCGPHHITGANCPNCQKPLLRLMAIDTLDPHIKLTNCPFRLISLFSCLTCELGLHDFYYQLQPPNGDIRIIHYKQGKVDPEDIPFYPKRYPRYFPGVPVQLIMLTVEQQWYIIEEKKKSKTYAKARENYKDVETERMAKQQWEEFYTKYRAYNPSAHQIGGIPELVQRWESLAAQLKCTPLSIQRST